MAGSSGGTRCESTSIFTPAACATRPASSAVVWCDMMLCFSAAALGTRAAETIEAGRIKRVVDKDVGALRESDQIVAGRGVSRNDDRPVGRVEAVTERRH